MPGKQENRVYSLHVVISG